MPSYVYSKTPYHSNILNSVIANAPNEYQHYFFAPNIRKIHKIYSVKLYLLSHRYRNIGSLRVDEFKGQTYFCSSSGKIFLSSTAIQWNTFCLTEGKHTSVWSELNYLSIYTILMNSSSNFAHKYLTLGLL